MTADRWRIGLVAALSLAGMGLAFAEPTLYGAAIVPLVYVCYGLVSGLSAAPDLRATRSFKPEDAGPGERVTVRLRLENTGDRVLPGVRGVGGGAVGWESCVLIVGKRKKKEIRTRQQYHSCDPPALPTGRRRRRSPSARRLRR